LKKLGADFDTPCANDDNRCARKHDRIVLGAQRRIANHEPGVTFSE
jgi:hypothetical protein